MLGSSLESNWGPGISLGTEMEALGWLTHGELYPGNEFNALLDYLILLKSSLTSMPSILCMLSQGTVAAGHKTCSPRE